MNLLKILGICFHVWDYSNDHDKHYDNYKWERYIKCTKCHKKELIWKGISLEKYIDFRIKNMDKKNEK